MTKATWLVLMVATCLVTPLMAAEQKSNRPNILWITIEDWSPDLSCYGTKGIDTPHVDKLASQGIRYERAFTTSPVCSTSRSAMMTGFHQNYIGANQHREYNKKPLPHGIKPIPHLFANAGYFTALMSRKTDCNFTPDSKSELFMGEDWSERKPDQPFFARITFGGTHRSWKRDPERPIDIADVELPPYYADTPFIRRDWANGLEQMQLVDREVGAILKRLDDEGLSDNTIVFFIGDHGRCHIRGKQFLYDGGIRIPMIMRWPGKVAAGQVSKEMVMSIDICATILEAAGIQPPVPLHGESLLGQAVKQRKYVFAARDKMDETHDSMRAIRSKDHKLILNLMPERPWCQYNRYKEGSYPVLAEMNVLNLKGQLTPGQAAFFAPTKPEVELFDLRRDPHEVNNVADDPNYAEIKTELLAELEKWRRDVIHDQGVSDEFRALDVFPDSCPVFTVDAWVVSNLEKYDFNKHGWPAWYPTRTLAEWEKACDLWEPYVLRGPSEVVPRPSISYSKKKKQTSTNKRSKQKETTSVLLSLSKDRQLVVYALDETSGTLLRKSATATTGDPGATCLSPDGDHLYVVMKKTGSIAAYRIADDTKLSLLGEVNVGADASYLNVHPSGRYLLSSYYAAGQVAVHRINDDHTLSDEPIQVLETDEKAHAIVLDPTGSFAFVPHTRPNAIFQFVFDKQTGKLKPNEPLKLQRKADSGPRHLWFHPEKAFAYGSDEQGSSVTAYQLDSESGQLKVIETVSSLPADGYDGKNSTSDIEVHPSGKFVYVANRGHNTIAGYSVDRASGKLKLLQHTPTEPVTRSFNISPEGRYLVAAGQTSGKLAVFQIDGDGMLKRTSTIEAGNGPWWVQITE